MHTFLPKKPPIRRYSSQKKSLLKINEIASHLPKLLLTNKVQATIKKLNKNSLSVDYLIRNKKEKQINQA